MGVHCVQNENMFERFLKTICTLCLVTVENVSSKWMGVKQWCRSKDYTTNKISQTTEIWFYRSDDVDISELCDGQQEHAETM